VTALRTVFLPAAALLAIAAPAVAGSAAEPGARPHAACIDATSSGNWEPIDDHTLLARSHGDRFKVTTATCPDLARPLPRITTVLPGGSMICGPHDARLYVSQAGDVINTPCFMEKIEPITEAEAKALEKRAR
jgi:hypothetical protein